MSDTTLFILIIAAGVYMIPSWIAHKRKHNNHLAILAVNLTLGWTLIGWIAALIWAATDNTANRPAGITREEILAALAARNDP